MLFMSFMVKEKDAVEAVCLPRYPRHAADRLADKAGEAERSRAAGTREIVP